MDGLALTEAIRQRRGPDELPIVMLTSLGQRLMLPAEQRAGTADRYVSTGQVQAGAMLLAAIAPELRDGYVRFYVEQAGIRSSGRTTYTARFDDGFSLPPAIRDALQRQIDIILSGI